MTIGRAPKEVVVITGVGGMGMAIARRLGAGRMLVLADYSEKALKEAATTLQTEGHWVADVPTDISSLESVTSLASRAAELGQLRALVHTAGVSPTQGKPERIIAVDVVGTALLLDAFCEYAQPGTAAVCIASMAGTMAQLPPEVEMALATTPTAQLGALPVLDPVKMDAGAAYSVAKRANQLRVKAAAVSWGAKGARVVSVSPGVISTPMGHQELEGPSGAQMRAMIEGSATQRLGTPDDIANAVQFLVSSRASFITGTDLLVDGGTVAALSFAQRP